jgi:hypothetical protein
LVSYPEPRYAKSKIALKLRKCLTMSQFKPFVPLSWFSYFPSSPFFRLDFGRRHRQRTDLDFDPITPASGLQRPREELNNVQTT